MIIWKKDCTASEISEVAGVVEIIKPLVSRLVVDVERFRPDKDEETAKVGMGAVYTKTHEGKALRTLIRGTAERRLRNLSEWIAEVSDN